MTRDKRDEPAGKPDERPEPSEVIGGAINIMGFKIDLGQLLSAPESLKDRLEQLREQLKAAGGRETLSDASWHQGQASVSGYIRTRGLLGEREFHIGTSGQEANRGREGSPVSSAAAPVEPPVDVFDEGNEVVVVADVPGVTLEDLDLAVREGSLLLETRPTARRQYRKELGLGTDLDLGKLRASCNNGVLEIRLPRRGSAPDKEGS